MAKHTETVCQQQPANYLSVFDHFVELMLKGLSYFFNENFFSSAEVHQENRGLSLELIFIP